MAKRRKKSTTKKKTRCPHCKKMHKYHSRCK